MNTQNVRRPMTGPKSLPNSNQALESGSSLHSIGLVAPHSGQGSTYSMMFPCRPTDAAQATAWYPLFPSKPVCFVSELPFPGLPLPQLNLNSVIWVVPPFSGSNSPDRSLTWGSRSHGRPLPVDFLSRQKVLRSDADRRLAMHPESAQPDRSVERRLSTSKFVACFLSSPAYY